MAVFSSLRRFCTFNKPLLNSLTASAKSIHGPTVRLMSEHRTFPLTPSRWQYNKFKDMLHFYVMIGLIPIGLIVGYTNVFIGPATLTEIPEGYEPKYWEYYRHPITRFFARVVCTPPQQEYEKFLHFLYEEDECAKIKLLENKVKELMKDRADYQAYYYIPYSRANYVRIDKERGKYFEENFGTNN